MLRETCRVLKSMWTEPYTTYDGKFFQLAGAQVTRSRCRAAPADLDRRRWGTAHASGGRPSCRLPATSAGRRRSPQHKCEVLPGHCQAVGRDYDEIAKTWSPEVFIRETEQEIIEAGSTVFWGEPFDSWEEGILVGHARAGHGEIHDYHGPRLGGFVPRPSDFHRRPSRCNSSPRTWSRASADRRATSPARLTDVAVDPCRRQPMRRSCRWTCA